MPDLDGIERTFEYTTVQEFYSDKVAQRSKVYKIHHVTEGVFILNKLHASMAAKRAFCLHPMTQDDKDLGEHYTYLASNADPVAMMLALEYRNIANQYLSFRNIDGLMDIKLSPIPDVNLMLIADKVQNYKDFTLYHAKTHPKAERLDLYFNNWLERLGVPTVQYLALVAAIDEAFPDHKETTIHKSSRS